MPLGIILFKDTFNKPSFSSAPLISTSSAMVKDLEKYLRIHEDKIKDDEYLQRLQDLEKYFNAYNKYLKNLKGLYSKKKGKFVEAKSEFKDFEDYLQDAYHKKPGGPYHQYCKTKSKIKHLIIDEFQDNNYLEFEIVRILGFLDSMSNSMLTNSKKLKKKFQKFL